MINAKRLNSLHPSRAWPSGLSFITLTNDSFRVTLSINHWLAMSYCHFPLDVATGVCQRLRPQPLGHRLKLQIEAVPFTWSHFLPFAGYIINGYEWPGDRQYQMVAIAHSRNSGCRACYVLACHTVKLTLACRVSQWHINLQTDKCWAKLIYT